MLYPPSLSQEVRERSFVATNGELGILPSDAEEFLVACRTDAAKVLGWELWVIDHIWGEGNTPVPVVGLWCGGIPLQNEILPAVCGDSGNADETERQLAAFDMSAKIRRDWLKHIRVNFTLAD